MSVHETTIIYPRCKVDESVVIGAFSVIGATNTNFRDGKRVKTDYGVILEKNVDIGYGTIITRGTKRHTHIMENVIIGHQCLVGHDNLINQNVQIMSGSKLMGFVEIGSDSFIGACTDIKNRVRIGSNAYIGMGSLVLEDVPDNALGYGRPFKIVRYTDTLTHKLNDLRRKIEFKLDQRA